MRKNPRRQFDYGTDPDYGGEGFRPSDRPDFNYLDGRVVAHDLLEHLTDDETLAGEMQALGASVYVRGVEFFVEEGQMDPSIEENIASDMLVFFQDWESGKTAPGKMFHKINAKSTEEFDEGVFLDRCRLLAKAEFGQWTHDEYVQDEDSKKRAKEFRKFCVAALPWIRKGFWAAEKKYGKYGRRAMLDMYIKIQGHVNQAAKGAYEGQQFIVDYDLDTGRVSVEEYYGEDEEL